MLSAVKPTDAMKLPSGTILDAEDLILLREFSKIGLIRWSDDPIPLKSDIESHVYVYGREDLTHNPGALVLLGRKILKVANERMVGDRRRPHFIGLPTAGTALAAAAAMVDTLEDWTKRNACFSVMREVKKEHGAHRDWVNGKPDEQSRYILLDNTMTDGQTKIEARERLAQDGFKVDELIYLVVIDRQQGAAARLAERGVCNVVALYNLLDITQAFAAMNLWPPDAVRKVTEEIAQYQSKAA